jgi:hypothetical protein
VQHSARQGKETPLNLRQLQPPANRCNTCPITRKEIRSAVRVRSSALSSWLFITLPGKGNGVHPPRAPAPRRIRVGSRGVALRIRPNVFGRRVLPTASVKGVEYPLRRPPGSWRGRARCPSSGRRLVLRWWRALQRSWRAQAVRNCCGAG